MQSTLGVIALAVTAALLSAPEQPAPEIAVREEGDLLVIETNPVKVAPPLVTADGDVAGEPTHKIVGAQADVGLPDGAGVSLLVMPLSWLRLHIGGLATLSGSGARAGLSLVAVPHAAVRPFVGAEVGYSFTGSARWIPFASSIAFLSSALENVSYGWASAHAGFEFGSESFAFVLRGGLSYLDVTFAGPRVDVGGASLSASSMSVRGVIPSARVGLLMTFF